MSLHRVLPLLFVLCAGLAVQASAQVTYTFGPGVPNVGTATYMPTAAYPAGTAAPGADLNLVNASGLLVTPIAFSGGMASDDRNGIIYTSNGIEIAMDQNLTYAGLGPLPIVPPGISPILLPFSAGPVTGLAFQDGPNNLWACDFNSFWPMGALPPFPATAAPLPIPGLLNAASGLGYDPADNSLWACDIMGFIYHFSPGGAPIGLQPVNVVGAVGQVNGLAINSSNGAGAFVSPPCSTQTPGYHVTVSDGFFVYDATGLATPIPMSPLIAANVIWGHTFSSDFQTKRCPTPGISVVPPPFAGTERVNYVGPGAPQSLRCIGATPLTTGFLVADLCPTSTCFFGLWFSPFSWTLVGVTTDLAGEVTFPVSFGFFPAGVQFSFQWAILDPPSPLGYRFSNLCTVTTGLP
ncbi:MAG: hypothetical protein V3W41_13280 [Planctomycetota bacterium]